jgi:hypothetical protein
MSKKHKKPDYITGHPGATLSHETEYGIIKMDLVKVVILNAVYLAAILALYYSNKQSHFLDNWFARLLNF